VTGVDDLAEWMTGFGTASRSDMWPLSGADIPNTANNTPPDAFRMSWRSVTVLSSVTTSITA
jgi:hypothetical protein